MVGVLATWKYGSPAVSVGLAVQSTVTWLLPGTRKKLGDSGAPAVRKRLSKTNWATLALSSREPGTVLTSSCWTMPSSLASSKPAKPATESTWLAPSLASAVASLRIRGSPGGTSQVPGPWQAPTATGAAKM